MKNITISVTDEVYRAARIRAAEQGTSVSALVAEYLQRLNTGDEFRALEELQRQVQAEVSSFTASDRMSRDRIHGRALR